MVDWNIPEPYASRVEIVNVQPIRSVPALRRAVTTEALIITNYAVPKRITCRQALGRFIQTTIHGEIRFAKIVRFNGSQPFIQLVARDLRVLERDQGLAIGGGELDFLFAPR